MVSKKKKLGDPDCLMHHESMEMDQDIKYKMSIEVDIIILVKMTPCENYLVLNGAVITGTHTLI